MEQPPVRLNFLHTEDDIATLNVTIGVSFRLGNDEQVKEVSERIRAAIEDLSGAEEAEAVLQRIAIEAEKATQRLIAEQRAH